MRRPGADRLAGALCLVLAALVALGARRFTVTFLADPVGPKALPYFTAALLALGGALILLKPMPESAWPERKGAVLLGAASASFVAYALLMAPLGFFLATALEITLLSRLFGARLTQSFGAGAGIATGLYALFVYGLGLPLPIGSVFIGLLG